MTSAPRPTDIKLHQASHMLEISFDDGNTFEYSCEYLRVHSPSAEVAGHGPGQEVLQVGKENVNIAGIVPVGNYAVQLEFDDDHRTGIYSWDTLYMLGRDKSEKWAEYLNRLEKAGRKRKTK